MKPQAAPDYHPEFLRCVASLWRFGRDTKEIARILQERFPSHPITEAQVYNVLSVARSFSK